MVGQRPTIYGPDGNVANPKPIAGFVVPQTKKAVIEETYWKERVRNGRED